MEVSSPSAVGIPLNFSIRYPVFHFCLTVIKKLLKGGKEKKNGARVEGWEQRKRRGEFGKCRNRNQYNTTVVQRCFLFKLLPFGCEGGGGRDKLRLSQVEYSNRLNRMKLLFLKVTNGLILAISYDSTILGSKEMII